MRENVAPAITMIKTMDKIKAFAPIYARALKAATRAA
jgi:hypothetical protein